MMGVAVLFVYSLALMFIGLIPGGGVIGILIQLTAGLVLTVGWLNFCLRLVRGEEVPVAAIFEPFSEFTRVWSVAIVISLLIAAGIFLFIVPGIYWMLKFGLGMFVVADEGMGVRETMERSDGLTRGHKSKLLVFYGLMIGLYGLSVFPYAVNMGVLGSITVSIYNFILTPILGVTYASAYDSLSSPADPGEARN